MLGGVVGQSMGCTSSTDVLHSSATAAAPRTLRHASTDQHINTDASQPHGKFNTPPIIIIVIITITRRRAGNCVFTARRKASFASAVCYGRQIRPSICPSVTLGYCVKTRERRGMRSSPSGSPVSLVSDANSCWGTILSG